jgi:hypothetical protein
MIKYIFLIFLLGGLILADPNSQTEETSGRDIMIMMENLQEKHRTILVLQGLEYDTGIKDSLFSVSTLERGRMKK